ncbi:probable phosphatase 2C 6 [Olea europaea subsp. europaea]|uniref:Probable phosphatase 2C 6 n=1 Tax=Olea europaea subsp. europaea TaxID=158383 RepID=A0A8S0SY42_OLEEU|nr:probable phosphatase 2C 6 [Olea europaea subsp. europaea]
MFLLQNFCTRSNTNAIFCGVFDGHGPFGHMVATKVRDSLPLLLREEWEAKSDSKQISAGENGNHAGMIRFDEFMDGDGFDSIEVDDNDKLPEMHMPLKMSILKAFKLMDNELNLHPSIDCFCSGTTAVTLIMQGQDLIIGNIGDSRAVLATRDKDNSLMAVQLTVDLKPNLPKEAARIQKCKGRVFALQDEPEVARVWLPNSNSPGLAMARAFGDFCLKDFGLISIPDVYYHNITLEDEFVVLATDGVWDVLSNKEAVDIVASAPGRATAARALVDCATRAWRLKYPTSKNDDCAVVCLFLQQVSVANVAKAQNNSATASEVERKVSREGGSNIDVVASCADLLVHSDNAKESGAIVTKAQNNVTRDLEVEMKNVPNGGNFEGSNIDVVASFADLVHSDNAKESGAIVAKAQNNVARDAEVETKNVPNGGNTEGSNIDVESSRADLLLHSDNILETGANMAKAQNNISTDSSEMEMKIVPDEGGTGADLPVHLYNVEESGAIVAKAENNITINSEMEMKVPREGGTESSNTDIISSHADLVHSVNIIESSEIEYVGEPEEEKLPERIHDQSKRSLAECLSTTEDEEWSALVGVTRVNSLLSLPRFLSFEKRSASWRKWL